MAYFLHLSREPEDQQNFLVVSDQKLDGRPGKIVAQIYFSHPPFKLESNQVQVISFPISKQEISNLLNLSAQKQVSSKLSLFKPASNKKDEYSRMVYYPSVQDIKDLLANLNIGISELQDYSLHRVIPDHEHELEGKHSIFWEQSPLANARNNVDLSKWLPYEILESNIINTFNIISSLFKKYDKNIDDKLKTEYKKFLDGLEDHYHELSNMADEVIATPQSSELKKEYSEKKQEVLHYIEGHTEQVIADLLEIKIVSNELSELLEQKSGTLETNRSSAQNKLR